MPTNRTDSSAEIGDIEVEDAEQMQGYLAGLTVVVSAIITTAPAAHRQTLAQDLGELLDTQDMNGEGEAGVVYRRVIETARDLAQVGG